MLCNQEISFRLRFGELLPKLPQSGFQIFYLSFLICNLLGESCAEIPIALYALQSSARQIVLLLVHG